VVFISHNYLFADFRIYNILQVYEIKDSLSNFSAAYNAERNRNLMATEMKTPQSETRPHWLSWFSALLRSSGASDGQAKWVLNFSNKTQKKDSTKIERFFFFVHYKEN